MNYTIEEYVFNDFNASSKARKDVSHFILENGVVSIGSNDKTRIKNNKFAKIMLAARLYASILFKLDSSDCLFLQQSFAVLKPLLAIKKIKKFKIAYLIHDLFSLRYSEQTSIEEHRVEIDTDMQTLSQCEFVIAHNSIMAEKLKQFGCTSKIVSLDIFDYYTNTPSPILRVHKDGERWKVAFAGHLPKSKFLHTIDHSSHQYEMIIYGAPKEEYVTSVYKGTVEPDLLPSVIEGDFGLIWEGEYQIHSADNYTRVNNPHKMSMYIVAGLPIIAWKDSAAGYFIEKHHLGVTISSLDEIDAKLTDVSSQEYTEMVNNCLSIRNSLIAGEHVRQAIQMLETFMNR